MNIPLIIAIIGSIGFTAFLFSMIFYFIGKKFNTLIPNELYIFVAFLGVRLSYLHFYQSLTLEELILNVIVIFIIALIIFPMRGFSFRTRMLKEDILSKLRESMTFVYDDTYSFNTGMHQLTTAEGAKIFIRSLSRDKSREINVVDGFNIKSVIEIMKKVLTILNPLKDIEEQNRSHLKTLLIGAVLFLIFILLK